MRLAMAFVDPSYFCIYLHGSNAAAPSMLPKKMDDIEMPPRIWANVRRVRPSSALASCVIESETLTWCPFFDCTRKESHDASNDNWRQIDRAGAFISERRSAVTALWYPEPKFAKKCHIMVIFGDVRWHRFKVTSPQNCD